MNGPAISNRRPSAATTRRMDGLADAIRRRSWEDVEFAYDQVLRSLQKEGVMPGREPR